MRNILVNKMKNWLPYDYLKTMKLKITVYSSRKEIIYWVNIHTDYLPWDDKCRWRSYTMSITNRWLSIMGTKLHLNSTHMKLCENICHGTVMMFCFNSGLPHLLEILVAWYLFKDHSTIEVHSIHDVFWKKSTCQVSPGAMANFVLPNSRLVPISDCLGSIWGLDTPQCGLTRHISPLAGPHI